MPTIEYDRKRPEKQQEFVAFMYIRDVEGGTGQGEE